MNHGIWIAKKNMLCGLVRKVSDGNGGDSIEWLREYCRDVLARYQGEKIDEAILCFTDLVGQLTYGSTWNMDRVKYAQIN